MADWKNILIAVDEMESSLRAVKYVGELTQNVDNVSICLLHIYPEPAPDFFQKGGSLEEYQTHRIDRAALLCKQCQEILVEMGVKQEALDCTCRMAEGKTISDTILSVREAGGYGTVVTGKRGISKAEEFLFGSMSNSLARRCSDFTTWIVG